MVLPLCFMLSGCKIQRPDGVSVDRREHRSDAPNAVHQIANGRRVLVERVIDGDTVQLSDGSRVRLAGIDAPESKYPGKAVQCLAPEASRYLKELVEKREVQLIVDSQRRDKYGRILGHIEIGSHYANGELVERGLAIVYRSRRSDRDDQLKSAESRAKRKAVGVWGSYCSAVEKAH